MKNNDRYWDCLDQAMEASSGGRTEEALAWLDEALKAHPDGAEAHNGRGEILWDEGRVDDALYEFDRAVEADAKFVTAHLNRAELLIEDAQNFEQALQRLDDLLAGRPELPRPDRATEAEIHYLKAKARFYLDDLDGALFLVRRASKSAGDVAVYRAFEGQIVFELGRFEEARRVLDQAALFDPDSAHAVYHRALALERLGEDAEALESFQRAHSLDPEHYLVPTRIDLESFERAAESALANLPSSIRQVVDRAPILIEDWPSEESIRDFNVSPQILGLFVGVPRTEAALTAQAQDVDRIYLFKRNLEKVCQTRAELIEQIQITVKHEVGHYLGLDEDDMERLGLA